MSEAKETPDRAHGELWTGPRAVLAPLRFDPHMKDLLGTYDKITGEGFDGVEWDFRKGTERGTGALVALAKSRPALSSRPSVVACRCDTTNADEAIHDLSAVIEAGASLGAGCLNVTLPPIVGVTLPENGDDPQAGFRSYQAHLNFTFTVWHAVRFTAAQHGVVLAVEAAVGGGLLSPVELRELIDGANSGSLGVCLDVARLSRIGSAADWMNTLRHRVGSVRLPNHAEYPGEVDTLLTSLRRCRYDRTIVCPDAQLITRYRDAMPAPP